MTHLLRSLIRQVLLESYTPEAPPNAPLGKYAFANVRVGSPKPPPEEDTKVEKALYTNLYKHFHDERPLSKNTIDQVLDFINQGLYADIFSAPPPGTLYRGLVISNESVAKKFLPKDVTFDDVARQIMETDEDFASFKTQLDLTNRNKRYTASWTKSLLEAETFATEGGGSLEIAIVLCATVEDNPGKWIDCEGLYGLQDIAEYENESEVIAAGTIRVSEVRIKPANETFSLLKVERLKNLPKDQRVMKGNLELAGTSITSLPEGLHVGGSLFINDTSAVTSLPKGLHVGGSLELTGTSITTLPERLYVGGSLLLRRTPITSLPSGLKVGEDLELAGTSITTLPADLKVGGSLYLGNTGITSLPDGLHVGGSLNLRDTGITSLPDGLQVGGDIVLTGTGITSLPAGLQIGGNIVGLKREYWEDVPEHLKGKLR